MMVPIGRLVISPRAATAKFPVAPYRPTTRTTAAVPVSHQGGEVGHRQVAARREVVEAHAEVEEEPRHPRHSFAGPWAP